MDNKNTERDGDKTIISTRRRNPWGFLAFLVAIVPFLYFSFNKGEINYQVVRYTLVISGFLGLILGTWAFLLEKKGMILSRLGVFLAIMGALLGSSIGVLALLPIVLNLK